MLCEIYLAHEISLGCSKLASASSCCINLLGHTKLFWVIRNQFQPVRISSCCAKFTWAHEINQLGSFEISFSQLELARVARNLLGHTKSAWVVRYQLQPVRISSCCTKFNWAHEISLNCSKSASASQN